MRRRNFMVGAGICSGLALSSVYFSSLAGQPALTTLAGPTMGTYFRIVFSDGGEIASELEAEAISILRQIDGLMSTYRADSEVSRFNNSGATLPMPISMQTSAVVDEAIRVATLSGGTFDITSGPLVELWGFGSASRATAIPGQEDIAKTARRVGRNTIRSERGALRKMRPDVAIDLSGIAKGYAVDQLAAFLDSQGISAYLVDIGGELKTKGQKPDGQPWRVGIERPLPEERHVHRAVRLNERAIATSGDYRDFFTHEGRRYAHTIDPRTGRPVTHNLASVTVIAQDAMTADALSTALMVMGPEEGFGFAETNGIAAYFIERTPNGLIDRSSPAFEPWLDRTENDHRQLL